MSELTIDSYFTKLFELETLANNPLSTIENINLVLTELNSIDNNLQTEMLNNNTIPSNLLHLRKLILLENERYNKIDIFYNLLHLIENKEQNMDNYVNQEGRTDEEKNNYINGLSSLRTSVKNIIENCDCMKKLYFIVKKFKTIY